MSFMGMGNKANAVMFKELDATPSKGFYAKPLPKGGNSHNNAPSGRNFNRGQTPSYKAKGFNNYKGQSWQGFSQGRGGSSKLGYSPYSQQGSASSPYAKPATPDGINFQVKNRGTALAKGAGGAVAAKASPGAIAKVASSKWTPWGLAAWVFWNVWSHGADRGSDGTLPDYLKNPGEQQIVKEGGKTPPYGSKIIFYSTNNKNWVEWRVKSYTISKLPPNRRGYTHLIEAVFLNDTEGNVNIDPSTLSSEEIPYPEDVPPPPQQEAAKSKPTTDHSKAKVEKDPASFPSGVRPPLPRDETAKDIPSKSFTKPKEPVIKQAANNTPKSVVRPQEKRPTNSNPQPTPKLIPVPVKQPEKTIEEAEQEIQNPPPSKGKVKSESQFRFADGRVGIRRVREATPEQIEKFKQQQADLQDRQGQQNTNSTPAAVLDNIAKSNKDGVEFQNDPLPQNDTETQNTVVETVVETTLPVTKKPPVSSVVTTPSKVIKENPTPSSTDNKTPSISSPPKQTPPIKDTTENKLDKLPTLEQITIGVAGLDILKQIADKAGGATPICLAPTLRQPIQANNTAIVTSQAAILGQGQVTQTAVNTANATLTSPQYGLARIQSFAQTAWKATRADKAVSALNTILIIHNAMMLSSNMGNTISEVLNIGLETLGIRDEEDEPIDINRFIKDKLESVLKSWLGQTKYAQLSKRIAAGSRIYQSGANIVYGIRNVIDAGQFITETIYENVSFIGNALRKDGVVRENSYRLFPTELNSSSRLLHRLEAANDAVEIIEEIASETKEIKDEIKDLQSNQKQFTDEIDKAFKDREKSENDNKNYATDTPEPSEEDERRGVENET